VLVAVGWRPKGLVSSCRFDKRGFWLTIWKLLTLLTFWVDGGPMRRSLHEHVQESGWARFESVGLR
jgi:hypothetical protein